MDHGLIFTIDLIIENFKILPKKVDHYLKKFVHHPIIF
jgi:hypothetical protein